MVTLSVVAWLPVVVLAACSTSVPGASGTGGLQVTVSGLPSGVSAAVRISGGAYSQTLSSTATLSDLPPGTYSITPQAVTLRRNVFAGTASAATVTVTAGSRASVSVAYSVQRGDLWVTDFPANAVDMFAAGTLNSSPTTPTARLTSGLNGPVGLAFDASGNLWVANNNGSTVVEYAASSLTSSPRVTATISSGLNLPWGLAFDPHGNLWVANNGAGTVTEYAAPALTSDPAAEATISVSGVYDVAFDADGNLWAVSGSGAVTEYQASALASNPSPAATIHTGLSSPQHLAFDACGNLWVGAQELNVTPPGRVVERFAAASLWSDPAPAATVTTSGGAPVGVALDVRGNLWVTHQGTPAGVEEFAAASVVGTGSPSPTATLGGFQSAQESAFDPPPYDLPLSH